ncbi:alpha-galactosidase [Segatella copri]|uniref:alpha-galactosidase n=1 Tax=Segatella copri TaxID=165179 RepID=UPI001C46A034|nr:alpha-galactosidase [Segatella copri]MBW0022413.1 alpha-galactosidase [Segatella copri]MBW0037877.1 alpha-galactosidase [Segatella copri]
MKKVFMIIAAMCMTSIMASAQKTIRVSTDKTDLVMQVSPKGRLYQVYLGDKLKNPSDYNHLKWDVYAASDGSVCQRGHEVYATSGAEDFFEPAVAVTHADGNMTTYLYYQSSEEKAISGGVETIITLKDKVYPLTVKLHYAAYPKENIIKAWSEISHKKKAPVTLWRYSSTMLYFKANKYFVTNYHSDWAKEGQPETCQLTAGKKIVDTKLGTRAAMQEEPFFELGFDEPAKENEGKVMLGTIGWPGNFRFTFEVDNVGTLRVIPAINPYASNYKLKAGETFTTPEFIFAMSDNGIGEASRNLHNWARQYQVNMGMEDRLTLLNNWENTGFDFNQQSLAELMKDAKDLGVDMFLLDDGWFANKYPRKDDHAGLGDWEATKSKLPDGIPGLVRDAKKAGVKFGIWIEPEMVNPKSELFEKHPDWVIMQPKRDTYYYRNQLVLDISNPKVQDYVFGIVDRIMTENPDVAYFKWDCNSVITNIYSPYHKENQGNFYIDHVRGIYKVLTRIHNKYPKLPMMLCSGGGGRMDYEMLKYFTEFWCSDDTDPYERLYIQWSLSKFFPAKTMGSHVTNWNKNTSVKFRTDVCSSCKLGFDIDLKSLSGDDYKFVQNAVKNYDSMKPMILEGDQYRLVSPYEGNHCAINYVSKDKQRAVLFVYDLHPRYKEPVMNVKMQGLDADKVYTIKETNLMPGKESDLECNGKQYSGDYLMKVGLNVFGQTDGTSHVLVLE